MEIEQIAKVQIGKRKFEIEEGDVIELEIEHPLFGKSIVGYFMGFSTSLIPLNKPQIVIHSAFEGDKEISIRYYKLEHIKSIKRLE